MIQKFTPHLLITFLIGLLADSRNYLLKNFLIKTFLRIYKPNLEEAIYSDINQYHSYNDFFTRKLKNRNVDESYNSFISPVDGEIVDHGFVEEQQLIQAKKYLYPLDELIGKDSVNKYSDGYFMTIYLAPTDYHRIHCPFKGKIISSMHLGKSLYSVNKNAQETIPKLYIKNERSVLHINSAMMNYALVSVGASVVGSIVPFWNSKPEHSRHDLMEEWNIGPKEDESIVEIGDELAHFRMGSTVILIFEDSKKLDLDSLNENKRVKFGSKLISLKNL